MGVDYTNDKYTKTGTSTYYRSDTEEYYSETSSYTYSNYNPDKALNEQPTGTKTVESTEGKACAKDAACNAPECLSVTTEDYDEYYYNP